MDQTPLSHCSMRLASLDPSGEDEPTAVHDVGDPHETDSRRSSSVGPVSGADVVVQTVPFHCMARFW